MLFCCAAKRRGEKLFGFSPSYNHYERVELIDTTKGLFLSPAEAKWMALSGSALLVGRK